MKKLILVVAVILGSFSIFATSTPIINTEKIIFSQEDFKEIKKEELPEAVKTALKTSYPDATLDRAYVNANKEYRLDITVIDQKATVYADANGNWIKK
ncbi:hypothetical protein J2X31_002692 [Flavobacterium arsenatis]|uniref:Beta-lactamase-inhibitor-like PepSY-like domain-containing protein n=1 Tax=Flavobacterium arsenatis TaxID=1484332 RepID=A0ABU1TS20_9FLAO|nr:hypothetical protein [Flavobacterium arsenatis]MDR6968666.1 hypothetical protein [Flavobacterium arsenatis]